MAKQPWYGGRVARVNINGRVARVWVPDGTREEDVPAIAARTVDRAQGKDTRPKSFVQGFFEGATPYAANAQRVLEYTNPLNWLARKAVNAVAGPDIMPSPDRRVQQQKRASARSPYRGSTVGQIAGGVVGSLPTLVLPGGPIIQSAATGAMGTEDPTNVKQLAANVALSMAAGKAGEVVGGTLGRVVSGNTNPSVRLLANEGVVMTPGMRAGPNSVRGFIEDKVLGSIPGLNAVPDAAALRASNDLRRAVANRVLKPIGERVPRGTHVDSQTIGAIQGKVYDAYDNAAGNMVLGSHPNLLADLDAIAQAAPANMLPDEAALVVNKITDIKSLVGNGPITGDAVRGVIRSVRDGATQYKGPLASALWAVDDALASAMESQSGKAAAQQFKNARMAVSLLKRMETAGAKAVNSEFGPTQLLQAARQRGYGTSTANVASGEAPLLDLATAAADVMRNKTANSGTIPRGVAVKALLTPGAGLGGLATVEPTAAALVGSQLLGYVPGLDRVLQYAALNRPQVLQNAGTAIQNASPYVGAPVAGGLVGLLGQ